MTKEMTLKEAKNTQCPVCGYYCLGKGGKGCIDKPGLVFIMELAGEKHKEKAE